MIYTPENLRERYKYTLPELQGLASQAECIAWIKREYTGQNKDLIEQEMFRYFSSFKFEYLNYVKTLFLPFGFKVFDWKENIRILVRRNEINWECICLNESNQVLLKRYMAEKDFKKPEVWRV